MSDMGSQKAFHQSPDPGQPIVAFDFDGTLTTRDSYTAFLKWRTPKRDWMLGGLKLVPAALARPSVRMIEA